jgi:hypothetical protein
MKIRLRLFLKLKVRRLKKRIAKAERKGEIISKAMAE